MCSAGYDAHWADPLAGLQFEPQTYSMLCERTARLAEELCQGRCLWILEGGYDIPSLCESVVSSLSAVLTGDEGSCQHAQPPLRPEPRVKVDAALEQVVWLHGLQ